MTPTVRGKMSALEQRGVESVTTSSKPWSTQTIVIICIIIFIVGVGATFAGLFIWAKFFPPPDPKAVAARASAASAAALKASDDKAKLLTTCVSCTDQYIWCADTQKCTAYSCLSDCGIFSPADCDSSRAATCKAGLGGEISLKVKGSQYKTTLGSLATGLDALIAQLTAAESTRQGSEINQVLQLRTQRVGSYTTCETCTGKGVWCADSKKCVAAARMCPNPLCAVTTPSMCGDSKYSSCSGSSREGFENPSGLVNDLLFLNTQVLSIKDTGFIGPYPSGAFNEETATIHALNAGFRFLTLHIDYMDTKKDLSKYEAPGEPTLLIRNGNSITSSTSGSIKTVADAIANNAFSPQAPNYVYPVIIYLHFMRAPSAVKDPDGYLSFMSKVAKQLGSLAPKHLGLTPQGNYTRQQLSNQLLTMPISSLNGTFIILSNADTSLFRNQTSVKKYKPAEDLDFWVNMRVFLDDEKDSNGITQLPAKGDSADAVLVSLARVASLSAAKQEAFAATGKTRYVIAMGPRTTNPTPTEVDTALNSLGVNAVPIDIFTPSTKDAALILNEYYDMTYRKKPVALQYQ